MPRITESELESIIETIHMDHVPGEKIENVPQSAETTASQSQIRRVKRMMAVIGLKPAEVYREFKRLGVKGASQQSIYRFLKGNKMREATLEAVKYGFGKLAEDKGQPSLFGDDPETEDDRGEVVDRDDEELAEDVDAAIDRTLSQAQKDLNAVWGSENQTLAAYLLRRMRRKASKTLPPSNA